MTNQFNLPSTGFLRLDDVLRIIPVSKSHWWAGVKTGKFPAGIKFSERITVWNNSDILELVERVRVQGGAFHGNQ